MSQPAGNYCRSHSCCRARSSSSSHENCSISFSDQHAQRLKMNGAPNLLLVKQFPPFKSLLCSKAKNVCERTLYFFTICLGDQAETCFSIIVHSQGYTNNKPCSKGSEKFSTVQQNTIQNNNCPL